MIPARIESPAARLQRVSAARPAAPVAGASAAAAVPVPGDAAASAAFTTSFHVFVVLTFVLVGRPQDFFPALIPLRLAMTGTLLTAGVTLLGATPWPQGIWATRETRLYLLFYAVMVGGIPFAVYRPGSFDAVISRYLLHIVYFVLFLVHVDSVAKLKRIGLAVLLSIAMFTWFGLRNGSFAYGRYDTGSEMYDPNDVAFVVVSLLGFALWVVTGTFAKVWKGVALATLLGGVVLVLFTASRGGLIGLITFLLLFMLLRVKTVKKAFKLVVAVALVVAAVTQSEKINLERYMTLGSIEDDYNFEEGGRADIWKRGWRLFLAAPMTGVGVDGFGKAIGDMRAAEKGQIPKWQTAHSSYVLVLTETGVVGSGAFLMLILTSLGTFNRLRRRRETLLQPELQTLSGFLLVGFTAQLVTAAFLSQTYSMFFTLIFALSAALNRLALTGVAPAAGTPATAPPRAAVAVSLRTAIRSHG
jgi:O-antigen ligase